MERGSIRELVLSRSILKHIRKNRKEVITGAAAGNDYARLDLKGSDTVVAQGVFTVPYGPCIAEASYIKALNNLQVSGAKPVGITVFITVPPECEEQWIRDVMELINSLAERDNIQVLGGHTEVSDAAYRPIVYITSVGAAVQDVKLSYQNIENDSEIIMTKHAGILGMAVITDMCRERLKERFAESYIRTADYPTDSMYIGKEAETAIKNGALYMHDISCGGLYAALFQAVQRAQKGFITDHHSIPIRQQTIELCEYLDINPYMLEGTGSLLIFTKKDSGKDMVKALAASGIEAAVIGRVTEKKDRAIYNSDDERLRQLFAPDGDELYHIKTG